MHARRSLSPGSPVEAFRAHAEFHARRSPAGVGAAVIRSAFTDGVHRWACVVSDGRSWRYINVLGPDLGPHPGLASEEVEEGIERFAATVPATGRLQALVNANPLHIDSQGVVRD